MAAEPNADKTHTAKIAVYRYPRYGRYGSAAQIYRVKGLGRRLEIHLVHAAEEALQFGQAWRVLLLHM